MKHGGSGVIGLCVARARRSVAIAAGALGIAGAVLASAPQAEHVRSGAVGSLSSGCVACHTFNPVLTHPTGVVATAKTNLPLVDGRVECITCHNATDQHRTFDRPVGVRSAAEGLCAECHKPGTRSGHGSAGTFRAHLKGFPGGSPGGIDAESTSCLSCHDGTVAADGGAAGTHSVDSQAGHPIGPQARSRPHAGRDGMQFVSAGSRDARIRLFDQAVGCGSCHSVYSKVDKLLVMSNLKSRLCLSCHVE